MSRQYWQELVVWATSDGTAVASSTTETIIFPNVTIPANYMQDGRALRLTVYGKYSENSTGTVTKVFRTRWGGVAGTAITITGTITEAVSASNWVFEFTNILQTRSNGSSGTIMGYGIAHVFNGTAPNTGSATGAPAIAPMTAGGQTAPATATCDLTADTALSVTITHGQNSASTTSTGQIYLIESLN